MPVQKHQEDLFQMLLGGALQRAFLCDNTAKLSVAARLPKDEKFIASLEYCRKYSPSFMSELSPTDVLNMKCEYIRKNGLAAVTQCLHPKSKIRTWDPGIYCGVMEHLTDHFQWNDVHWNIPKPELLIRVDEWNEALESYCNTAGLVGAERAEAIALHKATPFASCANLSCEKVENKVKEFSRYSRCLTVAYCSSDCLKEDWRSHKPKCVTRGEIERSLLAK